VAGGRGHEQKGVQAISLAQLGDKTPVSAHFQELLPLAMKDQLAAL